MLGGSRESVLCADGMVFWCAGMSFGICAYIVLFIWGFLFDLIYLCRSSRHINFISRPARRIDHQVCAVKYVLPFSSWSGCSSSYPVRTTVRLAMIMTSILIVSSYYLHMIYKISPDIQGSLFPTPLLHEQRSNHWRFLGSLHSQTNSGTTASYFRQRPALYSTITGFVFVHGRYRYVYALPDCSEHNSCICILHRCEAIHITAM